ncbi:CPBP family intramembrane glutamic endopeptidase [Streptomyces sp. FXJ1.4098]|uniref:lysostaphin resistance A-like protein n=1 Tax=Streptomyces sp. NPDC020845 TaxID=3365096 RepID=UPI0029989077|nr:CPBP family intramembrane glutamic endopeptidase [Streptomyces sp. FXJ1.4098]
MSKTRMSKTKRNRGVVAFLAITCGGTWLWLCVAHGVLGLSALNPLLQLPGFCMPGIAAIVVRRWVTREGFADAGLRPRLRAAWPYYLAAWLGPLALAAVTMALAAALGVWHPDLSPLDELAPGVARWPALLVLMLVVPLLTPVYWGEEFGWTSYLRPRLFGGRVLPSVVATSLIWAVWHYPLAFIGYADFENVALGLLVWTVSLLCQEVVLAWLYLRSGTVWVASLAHAGNNMVLFLLTGQLLSDGADGLGAIATMLLTTVPVAALAGWLAWLSRRRARALNAPPARRVLQGAGGPARR